MRFAHAGIATDDAAALAARFGDLFDAEVVHEERFEDLQVVFLALENGYLELLEPIEDGTIAHYLEDNGPGIHHLAVETDDIEGALERARELGIELIDDAPRRGAWGHEVAFLHPRDTGGMLVEFVASEH